MPTLADIYSAIDSAKRKGSDLIRNPGASLQQMAGYGMDRANAARDQLYEATEAEGIGYGPKTKALAQQMAGAYNPIGITTWHGSPHIFQKFDMSKLGTGEGAQAYGSGMYVAQNPTVAKEYKEKLSSTGSAKNLASKFGGVDEGIAEAQRRIAHYQDLIANGGGGAMDRAKSFLQISEKNLNDLNAMKQGLPENTGSLYKVDLPDTHIRRMLDWDAPIKEQPVVVRNLAKSLGLDLNDLGGDLLAKVGKDEAGRKVMQDAGIRGVKYLDERSRFSPHEVSIAVKGKPYASNQFLTKEQAEKYAAEKKAEGFETAYKNVGTKNFVVFDPNHMTILERNAKPIND
jgi:hypothetical protein